MSKGSGTKIRAKNPIPKPTAKAHRLGLDGSVQGRPIDRPRNDLPRFDPKRDYVYSLGAGPQKGLVIENNLVFRTWAAAGLVDTETFAPGAASPARDAATGRIGYITKDHYGNDRYVGAAADVGAVESH